MDAHSKTHDQFTELVLPWVTLWALGAAGYTLMSIILSYLETSISSVAFFISQDGWCSKSNGDGLGVHCWGDMALPFYGAEELSNGTLSSEVVLHNTPAFLHLLTLMNPLGFNLALAISLIVMLALALAPAALLSLQFERRHSLLIFLTTGIASLPFLLTFDRGNHASSVIGAMLLLYLLFHQIDVDPSKERWLGPIVIALGALIFALKFWSPIVVLIPLILRRARYAFAIFAGGVLLTIGAFLSFSSKTDGLLDRWTSAIVDAENAALLGPHSISISGFAFRLYCVAASPEKICDFARVSEQSGASLLRLVIAALTLAWLLVLAFGFLSKGNLKVAVALVMILPAVVLPDSGSYNAVGFVAALALILAEVRNHPKIRLGHYELRILLYSSLVPILVVPIGYFRQDSFAFLDSLDMWRFQNLATPISTLVLLSLLSRVLFRQIRSSSKSA